MRNEHSDWISCKPTEAVELKISKFLTSFILKNQLYGIILGLSLLKGTIWNDIAGEYLPMADVCQYEKWVGSSE